MKSKSNEKKIKEGRGQGFGENYSSFYTPNEIASNGTSEFIYDPIDKRMVSALSTVERNFFYHMRWNDDVVSIQEQKLMDIDIVNEARKNLGYKAVPKKCCYTTDFLIGFTDGTWHAYSVKWNHDVFNPGSIHYVGRPQAFERLQKRQNTEAEYWRIKDVPFSIVTGDDFNQFEAENIAHVLSFYDDQFITNQEQKLLYLIAHKAVIVPLDKERLNAHKLLDVFPYNIDDAYENFRNMEKEGNFIEICTL